MVSMNQFADIAMSFEKKSLPVKHIDGPMGVRGRNSDNTMIKEKLNWEPGTSIANGLRKTYFWIKEQADAELASGIDISQYGHSKVVIQVMDSLDSHAAGGGDRPVDQSDAPDKVKYVSRSTN
mmetsp:Transcript_14405/g.17124  ORF Transcript_14405/g.17124 Transcript_14405/m.17124 type:complete len:123 (-) Transcript_14405:265-633(-)